MKKLLLTSVVFLLGVLFINVSAQDNSWKSQAEGDENLSNYSQQYLAYQIAPKEQEEKQQKDPEEQTESVNPSEIIIQDEKINAESSLFYRNLSAGSLKEAEKPSTSENEPTPKKETTKEEDSVLEFNFLYFLIQKFKLSDILE